MKCKFCSQELPTIISPKSVVMKAFCREHDFEIKYYWYDFEDPNVSIEYYFRFWVNGKRWEASYYISSDFDNFTIKSLDGEYMPDLVNLDFIPNITPENILDKFPTLVNFS